MEESDKFLGYMTVSSLTATRGKDGMWKVKHSLTQKRSLDLEDWESKEMEIEAIDKTLDTAVTQTTITIHSYLSSVNGSLFNDDNLLEDKEVKQ